MSETTDPYVDLWTTVAILFEGSDNGESPVLLRADDIVLFPSDVDILWVLKEGQGFLWDAFEVMTETSGVCTQVTLTPAGVSLGRLFSVQL